MKWRWEFSVMFLWQPGFLKNNNLILDNEVRQNTSQAYFLWLRVTTYIMGKEEKNSELCWSLHRYQVFDDDDYILGFSLCGVKVERRKKNEVRG